MRVQDNVFYSSRLAANWVGKSLFYSGSWAANLIGESFSFSSRWAAEWVKTVAMVRLADALSSENSIIYFLLTAPFSNFVKKPAQSWGFRNFSKGVYSGLNYAVGGVVSDHVVDTAAEVTGHAGGGFGYVFMQYLPFAHAVAAHTAPFAREYIAPTVCSIYSPAVDESEKNIWSSLNFWTWGEKIACPEQVGAFSYNLGGLLVSYPELVVYLMMGDLARRLFWHGGSQLFNGFYNAINCTISWAFGVNDAKVEEEISENLEDNAYPIAEIVELDSSLSDLDCKKEGPRVLVSPDQQSQVLHAFKMLKLNKEFKQSPFYYNDAPVSNKQGAGSFASEAGRSHKGAVHFRL